MQFSKHWFYNVYTYLTEQSNVIKEKTKTHADIGSCPGGPVAVPVFLAAHISIATLGQGGRAGSADEEEGGYGNSEGHGFAFA